MVILALVAIHPTMQMQPAPLTHHHHTYTLHYFIVGSGASALRMCVPY